MSAPLRIEEDIDIPKITRGRGRPKGSLGIIGGRIRYRPKKWLPEFNQLVIDYIVVPGVTHEELGLKYSYTKVQVCNILNSPQARDIQESMAQGILKYNFENVPIKLGEMHSKIIERLHDFIHSDVYLKANPFEFINKSLAIGKAIGVLDKETSTLARGTTINNTQVNITTGQAKDLSESLGIVERLRLASSKEVKTEVSSAPGNFNGK